MEIGVATNMTAYMQYEKLEKLGVTSYINRLVTSEDAGADIATVPYSVIVQMTRHPLTDQGIAKLQEDYRKVFGE